MSFVDVVSQLLSVASQVLADWPALLVVTAFMPEVVNLLKWVSQFIPGLDFDGISDQVTFLLSAVIFIGYLAARVMGLDVSGIEASLVQVGMLIAAFLGLFGQQVVGRLAYRHVIKKLPGPFGYSFSK